MQPIIEFKDFSWKYKSSKDLVLNSINLKINKGEFIGIMGPTGAGKSTLCACINGLIPLKTRGWIKGTVEVFGENTRTTKMTELGKKVGLIFQDPESQFIMLTVEDEIALGLETLSLNRKEMKNRIQWALKVVNLEGFEQKTPEELSGGQKQRVAIASIMAMRPKILVLDEPTSDLDPLGKAQVFELLEKIRNEFDLTIILVSHETKKILEFCNRVVLLDEGNIKFDGSSSELLNHKELVKSLGIYVPINISEEEKLLSTQLLPNSSIKESTIVEISNLNYTYPNQTRALKNINLKIFKGEFTVIIGKNGSGKTTLIKHFNGLLKPQTGSVMLKNEPITDYSISNIAQIIGYCYQNPDHQLFKNTIRDEIEFGLLNLHFSREDINKRYEEIVEILDLKKFQKEYESTFYLSKGIRQRLALASVLVLKPEILIVDEPATGQHFGMIVSFMNILKELNEKNQTTVIIVTHNPYIITYYSHNVIILDGGKLIEKLSTIEFLKSEDLQKIAYFTPL